MYILVVFHIGKIMASGAGARRPIFFLHVCTYLLYRIFELQIDARIHGTIEIDPGTSILCLRDILLLELLIEIGTAFGLNLSCLTFDLILVPDINLKLVTVIIHDLDNNGPFSDSGNLSI